MEVNTPRIEVENVLDEIKENEPTNEEGNKQQGSKAMDLEEADIYQQEP